MIAASGARARGLVALEAFAAVRRIAHVRGIALSETCGAGLGDRLGRVAAVVFERRRGASRRGFGASAGDEHESGGSDERTGTTTVFEWRSKGASVHQGSPRKRKRKVAQNVAIEKGVPEAVSPWT